MSLLPSSLFAPMIWEESVHPIYFGFSLKIQRNVISYKFPSELNSTEMRECSAFLVKLLKNHQKLKDCLYFEAENLSLLDKELIFERFLFLESIQKSSPGQGFLIDSSGRFICSINLNDHLRYQWIDTTGDFKAIATNLIQVEAEMGACLEYAFSPKWGYLTSDPTDCGTAFRGQLYLHLPALCHTGGLYRIIKENNEKMNMITSLEGGVGDFLGNVVVLTNRYTLGFCEEAILHALEKCMKKLILAEEIAREKWKTKDLRKMKDLVSRACGLLLYSYQIEIKEALDSLSYIKLGVDMGWIEGIPNPHRTINHLFYACRQAHLIYLLRESVLNISDIPYKRACFLRKKIQGIKLNQ